MPETIKSDFQFDENVGLGPTEKAAFDENGYVFMRGLLKPEEVAKLKTALEDDGGVMSHLYHTQDPEQRKLNTSHWSQPGDDLTGVVARSEKVVNAIETLLGGEVYHYYAKVICKMPRTGGSLHWHQDYGYWYHNGLILPNVGTLWIAVDEANKENGCVQLLSGSNKLGRIEHRKIQSKNTSSSGVQDQTVADPERVNQAKKFFDLIYAEAKPGDAVFFQSNVLHRSDANESEKRRMAYLVMYNRADNNPVYKHHWSSYIPLKKVPNSEIMNCTNISGLEGKEFMDLKKHYTTSSAQEEKGLVISENDASTIQSFHGH